VIERTRTTSGNLLRVNRADLEAATERAGIPRSGYHLPDQDTRIRIIDSDIQVLEIVEGGWAVYYLERGERCSEEFFDSEDEACSELLLRLTKAYGDRRWRH
jgi:hypothetical protein